MKFLDKHFMIIVLSTITIIGMFTGYVGLAFMLWFSYGVYKFFSNLTIE